MEKEGVYRYAGGTVGNYDIYLTLQEGTSLQVVLLSQLDDSISSATITKDNMPVSCQNLFENVDDFFMHASQLLRQGKKELLVVSDTGEVRIGEVMERKGKEVRVECALQCEKVPEHLFTKFYLRIIRQLKQEKLMVLRGQIPQQTRIQEAKGIEVVKAGIRLFLTVEMINNPYISAFNKFQQELQIQQYSRTRLKLYFHEAIPSGLSSMSIKLLYLKNNAFAFGIMGYDQDRLAKSPYSIAFEYFTGEMKDTGRDKGAAQSRWRKGGGVATADLRNVIVRMEVNTGQQSVRFYCNERLVGETVVSNYLMARRMMPYVSCKHQGDSFQLNPV